LTKKGNSNYLVGKASNIGNNYPQRGKGDRGILRIWYAGSL